MRKNFVTSRRPKSALPAVRRDEPEPPPTLALQLAHIARRFGALDPARLAAIASLAFGEVRS